jgi:hypothetical protein
MANALHPPEQWPTEAVPRHRQSLRCQSRLSGRAGLEPGPRLEPGRELPLEVVPEPQPGAAQQQELIGHIAGELRRSAVCGKNNVFCQSFLDVDQAPR